MNSYHEYYSETNKSLANDLAEKIKDAANLLGHTVFYIDKGLIKPFVVNSLGICSAGQIFVLQIGANQILKYINEIFVSKELAEMRIDEYRLEDLLKEKMALDARIVALNNTLHLKKESISKCESPTINY